jgi:hypothetical protein
VLSVTNIIAIPGVAREASMNTGPLTREEMDKVMILADIPYPWREDMIRIAWCESTWDAGAINEDDQEDGLGSTGLFQLWSGWYREAGWNYESWSDPVANTIVAAHIRQVRGRFGGSGGWSCADKLGIW